MAKQFTLDLANPAITNPPQNVIYTDLSGGNALNLSFYNNYGIDFTIGGAGNGKYLLIKFPKGIMNDANAALVKPVAPWTMDGFYTPATDPDSSDNKDFYVFKMVPPAGGIPFKIKASIVVGLTGITPTSQNNVEIVAQYDLQIVVMKPSAQLTVHNQSKPGDKTLIGDNDALKMRLKVNSGSDTNPIVITKPPVTADNAAENKMQLIFDFQNFAPPTPPNTAEAGQKTLGHLVDKWDPANPPTFRIQFPYFSSQNQFPEPLDLTDDTKQGSTHPPYNQWTSAINIVLSLNQNDPTVQKDTWWQINRDPDSTEPSWLITPTAANLYLFTGLTSGPNASGPFLNIFFSHIYSGLPIDPTRPETLMFIETYNFPGFKPVLQKSDPISKVESVEITSFTGAVRILPNGESERMFSWTTKHATACYVSGDSVEQNPNNPKTHTNPEGNYIKPISLSDPLVSSYTLTAVGTNGTKIHQTINVIWKEGDGLTSIPFTYPTAIATSPDGAKIYVAGTPDQNKPASLSVLDKVNLVASKTLPLPNQEGVKNVLVGPFGKVFLAGMPMASSNANLYGFDSNLNPLTGSPISPGYNSSVNIYSMAVDSDGRQLILAAPTPQIQGDPPVKPFLAGYSVNGFRPSIGAPLSVDGLGPIGLAIQGNNVFYPTAKGLGIMNRTTFKPIAGSPISLKSDPNDISYTPGPLVVSKDGKNVTTLAKGTKDGKDIFILCQVNLTTFTVKRVQVNNGYRNGMASPTTNLVYSHDGAYLFIFGLDYTNYSPGDTPTTLFSVFNPDTLEEFEWSKTNTVDKFFTDMVMAPDGSRIYVSTLNSGADIEGPVILMVPYFA